MLEKTFSLLVYLKKPKVYKHNNPFQIYLRITVDGVPIALSAKRTWDPSRWNSRSGRAIGNREDARSLNLMLDLLTNKVHEARRALIDANKDITPAAIKNVLLGGDDRKYILKEFTAHNKQIKAMVPDEYSPGTLDLFERTMLHVERFIKWKYDVPDLDIRKLG